MEGVGVVRAVAGGLCGAVISAAAVVVWVVAAFWDWSFFGSSSVGPGQKVFMYAVSPVMLGAATVPVSAGLGAGWRRVWAIFAPVVGTSCFVCVAVVEEWAELPWELVVVGLFALPGVAAFFAAFDGVEGRSIPMFVGLIAAGVIFGVVAVFVWGLAEGVWAVALFVAAWVVFPAVVAGWRIGGKG